MEKKHWYTIIICSMLTLISLAIYGFYYREYVKPKSYTIGSYKPKDYTSLEIKEHLTSDDVLFSMDLDDVSFKIDDTAGTATYTYSANAVDFNGENNDYIIYVNNYMLSNLSSTAGAISGIHNIKYYDVDKSVLATSALNLSFASYTKQLLFSLTLPSEEVGLLLRYFEVNDFVVTLAHNPYPSSVVSDVVIKSHTVTFKCSSGTVTDYEGWTVNNGVYTKEVNTGYEIGTLLTYTPSTLSVVDYWYYLDSEGNKVTITSASIMPGYDIEIFASIKAIETGGGDISYT